MSAIAYFTGYTSLTKSPGFFAEVVHGAGPISFASQPLYLLLVGGMSSGTATPDVTVASISSPDDADTYFGAGSELACMCYAALSKPGIKVNIKALAVADGATPTAATAVLTVTGTWSTTGTLVFDLDGGNYAGGAHIEISVSASDTPTTLAAKIAAAVQARTRLFCSGASNLGVATLTVKTEGPRGNDHSCYVDQSLLPSGCVVTLTGGTAMTSQGTTLLGKRFTGGAVARDVTNALAVLSPGEYDNAVFSDNDATNAALIEAWVLSRAAAGSQRYTTYSFAVNDSYSTAASLAATTLNDVRGSSIWMYEGESHSSVVAAAMAAQKQESDQEHPNKSFDSMKIWGVAPHRFEAQRPTKTQIETALENGVSPIDTVGGEAVMTRYITTRCLNGSASDYRTMDVGGAKTPDRISQRWAFQWAYEVQPANEYVADDPEEGDPDPPESTLTPSGYAVILNKDLADLEALHWVTDVANNQATVLFNATGKHLVATAPIIPAYINHRVGVSIRNVTAA